MKVVSKLVVSVSSGYFFEFFMPLGHAFQVLEVHLIKIFKIEPPDLLFLVVFISFYISRYHFSQIFRTSFRIHNKDFHHKFSVLTDSLKPLNGQNLLSMLKFVGGGLIILATLCNYNREKRTYIPILLFQVWLKPGGLGFESEFPLGKVA